MRRFEFVEGGSSKFWEVEVGGAGGNELTVRFGRLGTAGQTQLKTFADAAGAEAEQAKLIREKTKKGYSEVGGEAPAAGAPAVAPNIAAPDAAPPAAAPKAAAPKAAAPKAAAPAAPVAPPAPPVAEDGWIAGPDGYQLSLRDGKLVARNKAGKVLSAVPKEVKASAAARGLLEAVEWMERHEAECKAQVEQWLLRSLPVPTRVLVEVWDDPAWRSALSDLLAAPVAEDEQVDLTKIGLLRGVSAERGLGLVTLDGDTRWTKAASVLLPHPVLVGELDEWRELLNEINGRQGVDQLFREVFRPEAGLAPTGSYLSTWSGGEFPMLMHAMGEARKRGYRVAGGNSCIRLLEAGRMLEARFELGEGDPMWETTTGSVYWVDEREQILEFQQVGPVAWSEGCLMASLIYARRQVKEQNNA
ncbi:MAG: DUF4132 domain-containing protein [Deltaproteobacteria bacterium]|nr:DUF4132 domain-containing protein [Deltaproteobacteria bacterium]